MSLKDKFRRTNCRCQDYMSNYIFRKKTPTKTKPKTYKPQFRLTSDAHLTMPADLRSGHHQRIAQLIPLYASNWQISNRTRRISWIGLQAAWRAPGQNDQTAGVCVRPHLLMTKKRLSRPYMDSQHLKRKEPLTNRNTGLAAVLPAQLWPPYQV